MSETVYKRYGCKQHVAWICTKITALQLRREAR